MPAVAFGQLIGLSVKTGASLALVTAMFSVAVAVVFPSDTFTVHLLSPTSEFDGVPESAPLAATLNHAGPETRE